MINPSFKELEKIDSSFKTGLLFDSPLMNTIEYMRGIKHEAVHPGYYMLCPILYFSAMRIDDRKPWIFFKSSAAPSPATVE